MTELQSIPWLDSEASSRALEKKCWSWSDSKCCNWRWN